MDEAAALSDALQRAAVARGPEAVLRPLRKLLTAMAWPSQIGRPDVMELRLLAAVELLEQAVAESPAEAAQITGGDISAAWRRAYADVAVQLIRHDVTPTPGHLAQVPCPWAALGEVLAAARERAS